MKLIKDWRAAWKWFSVQAMAISTAILATWALIPQELRMGLPSTWVTATCAAVLVLGIIGRLVQQK